MMPNSPVLHILPYLIVQSKYGYGIVLSITAITANLELQLKANFIARYSPKMIHCTYSQLANMVHGKNYY